MTNEKKQSNEAAVREIRRRTRRKFSPEEKIRLVEGTDLRVQVIMDGRRVKKHRQGKRGFAFSRLISCVHCGCSVVGEMKKQKYISYHCTGHKGNCGEPYVREEILEEKFRTLLGGLRFDDETMSWIRDALTLSHADERRDHEAAIERLRAEYDRLQNRVHAAYVDKLDGRIDAAFFDRVSDEWRREQEQCLRDIEQHQGADQRYIDEGVQLLELLLEGRRADRRVAPTL